MSRTAQQVLEFDRLKEILAGYSTCAPGHRAIDALMPGQDVPALGREALVCVADVSDRGACERMFAQVDERFGRVDVLVAKEVLPP